MTTPKEEEILNKFPFYAKYASGELDKQTFLENLVAFEQDLLRASVSPETILSLRSGVIKKHVAVLFDLDGTLVESEPKIRKGLIDAFAKIGLIFEESYATYSPWTEHVKEAKRKQMRIAGKPCAEADEAKAIADFWGALDIRSGWAKAAREGSFKVYPETAYVLDRMKKNNYILMVLSRAGQEETDEKIKAVGLDKYFRRAYTTPMQKRPELKSMTKSFGYMQTISQEALTQEILEALQDAKVASYLFFIGDRPEDVFSGQAIKRWATSKPDYKGVIIKTIMLKREGSKFDSRFADYVATDLQEALRIIENTTR